MSSFRASGGGIHPLLGRSAHAGRVWRLLSPAPAPVGIRTAIETAGDGALTAFAGGEACNEVLLILKSWNLSGRGRCR